MYAVRAQNSKVGVNCFFACFLRISIYKNQQVFFFKVEKYCATNSAISGRFLRNCIVAASRLV